jgi:hypothetical protein
MDCLFYGKRAYLYTVLIARYNASAVLTALGKYDSLSMLFDVFAIHKVCVYTCMM